MIKKLLLLIMAMALTISVNAKDILRLNNGKRIKGETIEVTKDGLTFQTRKRILTFKAEEIKYLEIDSYAKLLAIQETLYAQGIKDAEIHHRSRGAGNFCAGFFGGAIGFIIVAVTDAKAPDPLDVGAENAADTMYREGYNKKAKSMNLKNAGIGFGVGLALVLIIAAASGS